MTDTTHDDLVRQMNEARDFPANTCGTSRHAAMIAEALCKGENYPMLTEEPDHCGESIAATVAALWECRTKLAQQDDLVQAAVAAALTEAEKVVNAWVRRAMHLSSDGYEIERTHGYMAQEASDAILALITPDAQAALDRVKAEQREQDAKVAESVALPMDGKIAKAQAGYMRGIIAHHIREGGE